MLPGMWPSVWKNCCLDDDFFVVEDRTFLLLVFLLGRMLWTIASFSSPSVILLGIPLEGWDSHGAVFPSLTLDLQATGRA